MNKSAIIQRLYIKLTIRHDLRAVEFIAGSAICRLGYTMNKSANNSRFGCKYISGNSQRFNECFGCRYNSGH